MKFIYSNSLGDVELLLHRREKDTFMSVLQKKEFEPHLTYMEIMQVLYIYISVYINYIY